MSTDYKACFEGNYGKKIKIKKQCHYCIMKKPINKPITRALNDDVFVLVCAQICSQPGI